MDIKEEILARKYALAFLKSAPSAVEESVEQLYAIRKMLSRNPQFSFVSKLPLSFAASKKEILRRILAPFNLPSDYLKLVDILIVQQRLILLPMIMKKLVQLYRQLNNIELVQLGSSHELSNNDISAIKEFLEHKTKSKIVLKPFLDKTLIAGIRLQSDTFLWEYSIAQQLNRIERLFDREH